MDKFHLISPIMYYESLVLYIDNAPVATIQYKEKDGICEISKFCCSATYSLESTFGAFLSHFETTYLNAVFKFTSDRRFGPCDYVEKYGFSLESCEADYVWTDSNVVFDKDEFGSEDTEDEFFKLWDCGQAKYVKIK